MEKVKLEDICDIQSGGTPSRSNMLYWQDGDIPWVKISDINGKFLKSTAEHISEYGLNNSSAKVFSKGTILYTIFATLGDVTILDIDASTNQAIAGITLKDNRFDRGYIYYYLVSLKEYVNGIGRGVAQNNINLKILKSFEIPVISLNKQLRITIILDKLTDLINKRKQQLQKLDELVKAKFVEMFGDFRNNPMKWRIVKFTNIAEIDGNMTTDYEKYADYPHIGIDCIEKDTGDIKGYRTVKEDGVRSGKYIFTPQHLIYSKIRPNLNKVAIPNFEGLCSADSYPILPKKDKCNRIFLAYNMRSEFFLDYILQFCNRTNLPKVNRKEVSGFKTPLPPLNLQNNFANYVKQVNKLKSTIQNSKKKLELLKKSLMQEYFG